MRVFMTGGTGFIGSYIVQALVEHGHQVTVLARNPHKVKGFLNHPHIDLVAGDLRDRSVIDQALQGQDACIHVALGWGDTAVEMLEADTLPALYIFETAAQAGVKDLVYTSSTAAYGEHRPVFSETVQPLPNNFYGATKAATEKYLNAISHRYGIRANVIRPGYTFGNPVVEGASIYSDPRFRNIIRAAKADAPIPLVKNDGTQFIWAGDLAKIYTAVLASDHNRKIFNGLGAEFTTWEDIAKMAIAETGSHSEIVLEDTGRSKGGGQYDVSLIAEEFDHRFASYDLLKDHVAYLVRHEG